VSLGRSDVKNRVVDLGSAFELALEQLQIALACSLESRLGFAASGYCRGSSTGYSIQIG